MDIIVDPRFRDKIPKLNPEEYRQLEENILSDGEIRDPLILWRGYNILIDGHNRWKIYQAHSDVLPFPGVRELPFEDENAAVDWMLMNQLGRRNLNEMQITALRGQLYKTMKKAVGAPQGNKNAEKQCTQNGNIESDEPRRVSEQMANRLGIGKNTVIRAEQFLDGLDAAEAVVPGFKDEILSGQTKARQADVAELRKAEPEQIAERVEEIRKPKVTFPSGNVSKPKKLSPAAQEIAENDKRTTDKNAVVEYGIDDLLEDLRMLQNDFVDKYHHAIDLHMDVATDNGKKVLALMKEFETEWKEIKERVR